MQNDLNLLISWKKYYHFNIVNEMQNSREFGKDQHPGLSIIPWCVKPT
jgi:hypothetical protein